MKIVSTIEARMGSTRLPGKTLAPIIGRPMLELLVERLKRVKQIDEIVVATTVKPEDDVIEELANRLEVGCFRGSSEDVLERVLKAAQKFQADLIVEMTGDCPLLDVEIVEQVVSLFLSGNYDYVSNTLKRTYPRGLDTQVFPTWVLAEVAEITQRPADRENVSLYIYEHPEQYKLGNLVAPSEIYWPDLRLTVDTKEDLALVCEIYERIYPEKPYFSLQDVVKLLNTHPELISNAHIQQKPVR